MNMIGRLNPGLLTAPATPKLNTLGRKTINVEGSPSTRNSSRLASNYTAPITPRLDRSGEGSGLLLRANSVASAASTDKAAGHKKRLQLDSGVA